MSRLRRNAFILWGNIRFVLRVKVFCLHIRKNIFTQHGHTVHASDSWAVDMRDPFTCTHLFTLTDMHPGISDP